MLLFLPVLLLLPAPAKAPPVGALLRFDMMMMFARTWMSGVNGKGDLRVKGRLAKPGDVVLSFHGQLAGTVERLGYRKEVVRWRLSVGCLSCWRCQLKATLPSMLPLLEAAVAQGCYRYEMS